jgi:hypothetical protein
MSPQEDNNQLRQQLLERTGPQIPTSLHLTESQQLVLEEAAKAVLTEPHLDAIDEAEADAEDPGFGDEADLQEQQPEA